MNKKKLTIIIAAYNEGKNIKKLFKNYAKSFFFLKNKYFINLIIINDKSTDNTKNQITKYYKIFLKNIVYNFKLLNNSVQMGKSASIVRGIKISKTGIIFLDDADNECEANNIFKFLNKIKFNHFLCGNRDIQFLNTKIIDWPFVFGVKLTNFFFNLRYSSNLKDIHCGQKMFYTREILRTNLISTNYLIDTEICKLFVSRKVKYLNIKCKYTRRSITAGKKMSYLSGFLLVIQIIKLIYKK